MSRWRRLIALLILSVTFGATPHVVAGEQSYHAAFYIDKPVFTLNGADIPMDAAPFEEDGVMYYPVRYIAECLGISEHDIFWDEPLQRLVINWQAGSLDFWVENPLLRVAQGQINHAVALESAPVLHQGRVMLSLEALVEAFELEFSLNPQSQRLNIGNDAEFYYQLGFDCLGYGYDYDAILAFNLSLELDPYQANVHNELGYAYTLAGYYYDAWESLSLAIGLDGTLGTAYSNRALVNRILGDYDGALNDYSRAIQFGSNQALNYNNRGSLYFELGMFFEAWCDFTDAIELQPNFAPAYFNRAYTCQSVGEIELALLDYSMAVSLDPSSELYSEMLLACQLLLQE